MWQRLFYEWFLKELLASSPSAPASRASEEVVIAPRESGQVTLDRDGALRATGRQSNLTPRPGQRIIINQGASEARALGDGTRRKPALAPPRGFVPAVLFLPFPTPTPPEPHSPIILSASPEGAPRFGSSFLPTVALTQRSSGWNTVLGDPHDALWYRYAGYTQTAPGLAWLFDTDNRLQGPNWFYPYASRGPQGSEGTLALAVPVFDATPYFNLPDAFLGNVPTFAPANGPATAWWQFGREPYARATQGHHYVVPYAQSEEPLVLDGTYTTRFYAWPLAVTRGAVFTALDGHPSKLAHPLERWSGARSTVGTNSVWRYHFTPALSPPSGVSIGYAYLDEDEEEDPVLTIPTHYNRVAYLEDEGDDVVADGRERPVKTWQDLNVIDRRGDELNMQYGTQAQIATPAMKGIIQHRYTYFHASQSMALQVRFGLAAYAETSYDLYEWDPFGGGPESLIASGVGYALGGWFDSLASDPAFVGPESTQYDPSDPRMRDMIFMRQALRVLRVDSGVGSDRLRFWWSQSQAEQRLRDDPASVGFPEETTDAGFRGDRLGVEYDWLEVGWVNFSFGYATTAAPTVPTVGRFSYDDFGPVAVTGIGLRMSHQEEFDDFPEGTRTIGRILTLVEPADLRSFFPPTAPAPHEVDFPTGTFNGEDYDAYASAVQRLYTTDLGDLGTPYGGGGTTFAGLPVNASGTYSADALISPDGVTFGAVVDEDHVVRISRDGALAWEGPLAVLLGTVYEASAVAGRTPQPHQRHLLPGWPFGVLVLTLGLSRVVLRARSRDDRYAPGDAPLVFSHLGGPDAA